MLNVFGTKGEADPQNGEYEFIEDDEVSLSVPAIVTEGQEHLDTSMGELNTITHPMCK